MSKLKHTPGPWKQQKYGDKASPYIICQTAPDNYNCPETTVAHGQYTGGGYFWPSVGVAGKKMGELKANARLIAAAPEMLEVLIYIYQNNDGCGIALGYKSGEMIEDIFKKATGEKIEDVLQEQT